MILESNSGPCVSANHLVDSVLAAAGLGVPAGPVELTRPSSSPRGAAESREGRQAQLLAGRAFQHCWGSDSQVWYSSQLSLLMGEEGGGSRRARGRERVK